MKPEIHIQPSLITWAIARAGHDVEVFLDKHPVIRKWVAQEKTPTLKQMEDFAHRVHIPFGYLFLTEPPEERIPFPFFRSGQEASHQVSLNVFDTIQILQRRQDWITEYLIDNEQEPLPFVGKFTLDASVDTIVEDIRYTLKLAPDWAKEFATYEETLGFITHRIENIGVFVNFNGIVENNTRRPISVEECRGFVLVNDYAPFMFVNAADAKAAQLFTIVHELVHVWLGASAGFENQQLLPASDPMEQLCDLVAAEFLVPRSSLIDVWQDKPGIDYARRIFKVSPIVIARRAMDIGLISRSDFFVFYNDYIESFKNTKANQGSGGDFYATTRKRLSVSFATYVHQAVNQNRLLHRDAYKITGLKGDTFQKFVTQHLP